MTINAFITHKKAESYSDCQDRFSINFDTKSIALSDGMSQSIFQKYWAEILVKTYTDDSNWIPNLEEVRKLYPLWKRKVEEVIQIQKESDCKTVWRAERSLREGYSAGATFLGIRFHDHNWECHVLGDSCLIHIRNNKIIDIITSENVSEFDSYPDYYDSNPQKAGKGEIAKRHGELLQDDVVLLVSDPFSDFLFKKRGSKEEPVIIEQLLSIKSHTEFEEIVREWRKMGMNNDDSTLIIILPDGSDDFHVKYEDSIMELINYEKTNLKSFSTDKTDSLNEIDNNLEDNIPLDNYEENTYLSDENVPDTVRKESYSFNFTKLINDDFFYNLEVCIYTNLKGFTLFKRQKKDTAKKIAEEIKTLIYHSLIK